jgi:hypothetical protein
MNRRSFNIIAMNRSERLQLIMVSQRDHRCVKIPEGTDQSTILFITKSEDGFESINDPEG